MATPTTVRLTTLAAGGGCACKIPPGELEDAVRGLAGQTGDGTARRARHRRRCRRLDRRARPGGRRHRGLLHPRRRRSLRLGPDRRGQRAFRRLRDGRQAGPRRQSAVLAAREGAVQRRSRGAARRARRRRGSGLHRRRRPQHRRSGAEVRHGRHRGREPGSPAAQRFRASRHAAHADQAARASASSTTGTRPPANVSKQPSRR